jgi:hypothetical protein
MRWQSTDKRGRQLRRPTWVVGENFKPVKSGDFSRPAFYLHIAGTLPVEEVRKGVQVSFTFDFELYDEKKHEIIVRQLILSPAYVAPEEKRAS